MLRQIIYLLLCFVPVNVISQNAGDSINRTDANGMKQGFWKKYDETGMLKYEGNFIDNNPVGEFIYFYPDGVVKARSRFYERGDRSETTTFHHIGKKMTEGFYLGQVKDSLWKYYSSDGILLKDEFYRYGKKEGKWITYYENGQISEEVEWKADSKNGIWKQYYPDGQLKLTGQHINGEKDGEFKYYNTSGKLDVYGSYHSSLREGEWFYLNEESKVIKKEIYKNGNLIDEVKYEDR